MSGTGGGQVSKLSKRIEELQSRLMTKTDDLSEAHRSKSEVSVCGLTNEFKVIFKMIFSKQNLSLISPVMYM